MSEMTSNRAYLVRALYEWILDNDMTPHLLVDAEAPDVQIPNQFVEDGRIVLNVSPSAIQHLEMGNEWILFDARFGGVPYQISLSVSSVLAIYARENGRGMIFPDEDVVTSNQSAAKPDQEDRKTTDTSPSKEDEKRPKGPPNLTIVS